ncbi:MAG: LytTR family transcriptional regulator DNA-binding domain-containing protein [Clostridia bacterium]|nr:LytTR family transcriptional regulator DNA-binding domain-containing protein [Clostridia bacterium]
MELLFKIVICDGDAAVSENIYKQVLEAAAQNDCKCLITQLYSGKELTDFCKDNSVDIIFMDIDMPDSLKSGNVKEANMESFNAVKQLQAKYPETEFVFVSAYEELAYQSFRYRPFSFVIKRDLHMLSEDLGVLFRKINERKTGNSLFHLTVGDKTYTINTYEIAYFKSDKHYTRSYTEGGKEKSYRLAITDVYKQLKELNFIYVHRSYLVNCKYIKYFDTQNVILLNDLIISVTRDEDKLREAQGIFGRYKRSLR